MSKWEPPERCQLCGHTDRRELRWSLVKWKDAEPGMSYEDIGRCTDFAACRSRVTAEGEPWPLHEKGNAA